MQAAQEFIGDIAGKISMPEVYMQVRKLMQNPKAKIEDYQALVNTDSMLAIRIMRIANSEFFGFHHPAQDLYEAISLIGIIQLHDVVLSGLCMRTFYNIPGQLLNFDDFWRHSVKCGIAARRIARLSGLPATNRFFSLGLLVRIGHAAMFVKAPDLALNAMQQSQDRQQPIALIEREQFGFDYGQLGAVLMRQWHLPDVYPQVIEHHLSPEQSDPAFHDAAKIVNLAYLICEESKYEKASQFKQLVDPLFSHLPDNFVEIISNDIRDNSDKVFELLSPPKVSNPYLDNKEMSA